jgi:hypothetical protein
MSSYEYGNAMQHRLRNLEESGFKLDSPKTLVTLHRLKEVRFTSKDNYYYKIYETEPETVPLSMLMRRRDNNHYLNVNMRCN